MTVGAVVLAAGGGSRYRGPADKLLAPLRGRPVVVWALEAALAGGFDRTLVVTGAVPLDGVLPDGIEAIGNRRWAEGQATSLAVAIDWAGAEGLDSVVVGLGDQPLVSGSAWRAVGRAPADAAHPIVAASYGGRRGNPVRLDRRVWPLLPTTGDEGARVVMRRRPELVAEVPCDGEPADIDTWEDLERWS